MLTGVMLRALRPLPGRPLPGRPLLGLALEGRPLLEGRPAAVVVWALEGRPPLARPAPSPHADTGFLLSSRGITPTSCNEGGRA